MELIETKVHIGENKISIGDLYNNVRLIDKTISTSHRVSYEVIDGLEVERVISLNLGRKVKEPKQEK